MIEGYPAEREGISVRTRSSETEHLRPIGGFTGAEHDTVVLGSSPGHSTGQMLAEQLMKPHHPVLPSRHHAPGGVEGGADTLLDGLHDGFILQLGIVQGMGVRTAGLPGKIETFLNRKAGDGSSSSPRRAA